MKDMFYTIDKLRNRIHELDDYRYRDKVELEYFNTKLNGDRDIAPNIPTEYDGVIKTGEIWKGRDLYLWMQKEVDIPSNWENKTVVGIFDFGETGAGNNSGFESLFYLNDKPYQGVDSNHKEVFLPKDINGTRVELIFRLWTGLEGGGIPREQEHRINRAQLAWLDEKVDDLFYNASVILETIGELDEYSPDKVHLTKILNNAFKLIDWAYPGNEDFYNSLHEASDYLNKEIDKIVKHSVVNVTCIGHTHIDVAWLWRLKHTREKCARSFSTVLRLMERYPEYIFLQTQPQLYEYVKNDYPELYEAIKQKVKDGNWEVDGGMWLEADCNIPSGESLVRQILVGSRFIKEEFNKDVEYLWLPDVFGYSWALPQILKKSGIDMFMTTKISWNQYNRMPHDTFKWRGIDGSEILTHFITTPEPWSQPGSWFYTYNGRLTPKTVKGVWDAYTDKGITNDLLVSYGFGDGGGGVNREMLEYRKRLDKMPGLPNVKTGKASEYFRCLKEKVEKTDEYVHTWDGELYLEYHRGTYTSQAYTKMMNRKLELLYRETEWLSTVACLTNNDWSLYANNEITKGWKTILRNQFHDIIPGSSITEVYEDAKQEYKEAEDIALDIQNKLEEIYINKDEHTWTIVNNSNWDRNESIDIKCDEDGSFYDEDGNKLKYQRNKDEYTVEIKNIPALGYKRIILKIDDVQDDNNSVFEYCDGKISTPKYNIEWNEYGQLISIYDKENKREVLAKGERGNVLQMFEDKPMAHEAWDIDIFYQEKMREVKDLQSVELIEDGNIKAVIRFKYKYMNTTISQDMIVYANSNRIDFKTNVDWREKKQLLKVAFVVDIRSTMATYDVQFGNVKRPTHWNTSWDRARFESVAQQWVDLSERNYGVSLLNNCKYGHDIKDNVMRLTLLKSATHPDPVQDQGEQNFTYSLLPHSGDFIDGNTVKHAYELNQPLKSIKGMLKSEVKKQLFKFNDANILVDAIKKAEDEDMIIIRFHDYSGSRQNVSIDSDYEITGWMETNLMEKPIENLRNENSINVVVNPYEIKTLMIKMK
ncbi:alpha mannosidase, middle domain protein [[Clostridium] bifermentans ATCC 19299]|uniref:alpha-mannosidase n=1 Tax=Paraclostridium bifermentans TaxID=1490 RepID=UPI00038DA0FC|nr:alpha-mannosidase [Paraclostridium bifermentans]EQK45432.1 alpha mannosidase, middle domain protein [[Clostridium] bifermentans ATCC 19299] [Paraclostridium bifermentans ATCC 19299]